MIQYEYDDEYWKKVVARTCPECEHYILEQHGNYQCTGCTLKIYGNPQFVSYHKIQEITHTEENRINYNVCPECGATREDNQFKHDKKHGELTCLQCGLVLDGTQFNVDYPFKGLITSKPWLFDNIIPVRWTAPIHNEVGQWKPKD